MTIFDEDDLLSELGVEIPWPEPRRKPASVECGEKAPALRRHTDWSNAKTFEFGGYLAMVVQSTCEQCGSMRETFEGVFAEEVKVETGARRLQAVHDRGQWPQLPGNRCEVRQAFTKFCPDCIRKLGFDHEVEAGGTAKDIWIR